MKNNIQKFLINLIVYILLLAGWLSLYEPFSLKLNEKPRSAVEFVYQQF